MLKKINNSGDTIVEVMIILAIVGAAIIGSTIAVNNISEDLQNANYRQQAIQVAQDQMELIKAGNNEPNNGGSKLSSLSTTAGANPFCMYSGNGQTESTTSYSPGDIVNDGNGNNYGILTSGTFSGVGVGAGSHVAINSRKNTIDPTTSAALTPYSSSSLAVYYPGYSVSYSGSRYVYVGTTSSIGSATTPTSTAWQQVTSPASGNPILDYNKASSYSAGSLVKSGSNFYNFYIAKNAIAANTSINDTTNWASVDAASNSNSYDDPNIWNSTDSYVQGDIVTYSSTGQQYLANLPSISNDPTFGDTTHWLPLNYERIITYSPTDSNYCNFDITGANSLSSSNTSKKFFHVNMVLSNTASSTTYTITATVSWNGIGRSSQNSKVTVVQTMVTK